jgi:hypothetical protein
VVQSGKGADVGGFIGKAGLSLSVSLDKSEGFHQAVRNLIELSTIEILGKLTRVPYWQCLSIESTNPNYRTEARGWFDTMGETERERVVSVALVRAGYLRDEGNGPNPGLSEAVARYQAENDLVPNGRVDFDLYYRLLASDGRRPTAKPVAASPANAAVTPALPPTEPPRLVVSTPRGPRPSYRVGETMVVSVQPTQDAYVYCFYKDSAGTVARIFPNRFQPDPLLRAGVQIEIPPAGTKSFALRFDNPGSEAVACLGSDREVGLKLPDKLKAQDLEPLPVSGLDDVASLFRGIQGARVDDARLTVEVMK